MANGSWKIARARSSYQLPLLLVFALALALVLIGKSQSSLFDRARAGVTDWMAPGLKAVRAPLAGMDRWVGSIGEIFSVYEENLRLKDENARLRQWQNAAIVLQSRVKRYQLLLRAVPDPALSSVLARVIGRANQPFLQTMILDAGKTAGVKPGQAVVDSRGMIGRIFLAGQRTAWVILLTDLNSRIPVSIEPANVQAIMAGDNSPAPSLETVSLGRGIRAGDQVVSSGDGDLLPSGLPIGTVVAEGNGFRVALLADPGASQDVEIIDFKTPAEQPPAPSPKDLPVAAAGLPPATASHQPAADIVPQAAAPAPSVQAVPPPPQLAPPKAPTSVTKPMAAPPAYSLLKAAGPAHHGGRAPSPAPNASHDPSDNGNE